MEWNCCLHIDRPRVFQRRRSSEYLLQSGAGGVHPRLYAGWSGWGDLHWNHSVAYTNPNGGRHPRLYAKLHGSEHVWTRGYDADLGCSWGGVFDSVSTESLQIGRAHV